MNHHSRRDFLKRTGLALGAAVLGPTPFLLAQSPATQPVSPTVSPASATSATGTPASGRLRVVLVGCGGQGRGDIRTFLGTGEVDLAALCDPDDKQVAAVQKLVGEPAKNAKTYSDYRKLLDDATNYDAVVIATPDHWHAPLTKAFMKANKHVYCEKPLTHTILEAREIRQLSRTSPVVTQMGNQGSGSPAFRRALEVIQAGALGDVREIHHWGLGLGVKEGVPSGEAPVPSGLNWDLWLGPAPVRPYQEKLYHTYRWRDWADFGEGSLGDFGCHSLNLPMRAFDLGYPNQIVLNMVKEQPIPDKAPLEYHFPARGSMPPLVFYWHAKNLPPPEILAPVEKLYKDKTHHGVMIVGEKGIIFTSYWNTECMIQLKGDSRLLDILYHAGTKDIPKTIPRVKNHYEEWVHACKGQGTTFSNFETGGKLNEISLAGLVALRVGKSLDWDGEKMVATNAPEAANFTHYEHRTKWLV